MELTENKTKWTLLLILSLVAIVYSVTVFQNDFTTWDDNRYITENELLKSGDLAALISQPFDGHFHPVTMISLKIDYLIGGLNPFMFQFTNVFLHLLNTLLVFKLLKQLFNDNKMALLVAALFGLAAVNVESVAWMSERKNVLSTFFYLLTALYYLKSSGVRRNYFFALLFFALGIFSKVTVISIVPCLFLFDFVKHKKFFHEFKTKIPFIILAIIFGLIAVSAQSDLKVESLSSSYSWLDKLVMSSYAFTMYFIKPFYPIGMSAIYPYPINESAISLYGYYIIVPIVTIGTLIFLYIRKHTVLFFGLLFFIFNIALLLKFFDFPLGDYILADRYDYIPMIGLGIFGFGLFQTIFKSTNSASAFLGCCILLNIPFTFFQIKTWKNDSTLFDRVLENYPNSDIALNNRGMIYMKKNETKQAMMLFKRAYENNRGNYEANLNLANLLTLDGQPDSALSVYNTTIANSPNIPSAYYNRAVYYFMQKRFELAYHDALRVKELQPHYPNLDVILSELAPQMFQLKFEQGLNYVNDGKLKEAIAAFNEAVYFNPADAASSKNLETAKTKYFEQLFVEGINLGNAGDIDGAIGKFEEVLRIEPQNKEAKRNIFYANSLRSKD